MAKEKIIFKKKAQEKKVNVEPIIIGDHEYVCLNKSGPTDNSSCAEDGKWENFMNGDPRVGDAVDYLPEYEALCKCHKPEHLGSGSEYRDPNGLPPFADLATKVPLFREPMRDEMDYTELDIDECTQIKAMFSVDGDPENYLGCIPPLPNSPLNCDCDHPYSEDTDQSGDDAYLRDSRFAEYVRTARTYSTFWDTPRKTPLLRKSLMNLYTAQIAVGSMPGNFKLKVGDFIEVQSSSTADDSNSLTGTWLVAKIVFSVPTTGFHKNVVTLIRDTKGTWDEKTTLQSNSEEELFGDL